MVVQVFLSGRFLANVAFFLPLSWSDLQAKLKLETLIFLLIEM